MPPGPCQTAGRLRGKGWFNEHEEKILVNRILRDDPSKGDMHNRQGVNLQRLWKCLKDYDLWPLYIVGSLTRKPAPRMITNDDQVGLTNYIPPNPPQNYLSYILRQMGFSTFEANLLTIPSQFLFGVNVSDPPFSISFPSLTPPSSSSSPGSANASTSAPSSRLSRTSGFCPGSLPSLAWAPAPANGPTRQQDFARHMLFQCCAVVCSEVLLRGQEQAPRGGVGEVDGRGED
ncbi:hypothetical protein MPH_11328 [Macrophomina phaseolina MS6]|uniref:Uncharacterized protein n=1 Tax=Macrophomina phaseolina (strain MS6) TaxID=1126212 RepID=K2RG04_MACPH|nr:hypothetical protein MPH_11328 [Macrophomina phaseolina MS6]